MKSAVKKSRSRATPLSWQKANHSISSQLLARLTVPTGAKLRRGQRDAPAGVSASASSAPLLPQAPKDPRDDVVTIGCGPEAVRAHRKLAP